jgi:hypothetical protein
MNRFVFGILLLLLLSGFVIASPLLALSRFALAIRAHNAGMLSDQVDFDRLRRSITEQIIWAYRTHSARAGEAAGSDSPILMAASTPIAAAIAVEIVNPASLIELLNSARVSADRIQLNEQRFAPLPDGHFGSYWDAFTNSEYGIGSYSITLPPSAPSTKQYRLRFKLLRWHWKLVAIDLPETLKRRLADKFEKAFRQ